MGRLKDAVMDLQAEIFEQTGQEISFDEAGELLVKRLQESCDDCRKAPGTVHYVMGAKRCPACAEAFGTKNREERAAREKAQCEAHVCGETDDSCEECCEHEEHDHGICCDCGKDITDDLVGRAEDLADRMRDR